MRVLTLMLLSTLATEKDTKELLNESSLSSLVDFLGKSVRNELPKEGPLWTLRRRTMAIRTLEKMITSDELVVPTLLKLNLLPLLGSALEAQNATKEEIRAALTCALTLSHNTEALQCISKDAQLVKSTFKLYFAVWWFVLMRIQAEKLQADSPTNNTESHTYSNTFWQSVLLLYVRTNFS